MKHIILDIHGVIYFRDFSHTIIDVVALTKMWRYSAPELMMGTMSHKKFYKNYSKFAKEKMSYSKFCSEFKKSMIINYELIRFCKKTKCKISILSNNSRSTLAYLRNIKLAKWTETRVVSCFCHLAKPKPAIYHYLLKKIKAQPKDCIFVDDHKENTVTAKKIGMKTIHFKTTKQCIRELKQFLKS